MRTKKAAELMETGRIGARRESTETTRKRETRKGGERTGAGAKATNRTQSSMEILFGRQYVPTVLPSHAQLMTFSRAASGRGEEEGQRRGTGGVGRGPVGRKRRGKIQHADSTTRGGLLLSVARTGLSQFEPSLSQFLPLAQAL